jgi:hypothetical protein
MCQMNKNYDIISEKNINYENKLNNLLNQFKDYQD